MQHIDVEQRTRQQGEIDDGARPHDAIDFRFPGLPAVNIDIVVISDQAGFPADLLHYRIAGVDAEAALDAAELCAIAYIYACRTYGDALIAIDAIAGGFAERPQFVRLLQRRALFPAVVFVGDVERPFVGKRGLDARPWAHVDANLFAHEAGEH